MGGWGRTPSHAHDARQSHRVRDEREARRNTKKGREKAKEEEEEVCANPASGHGSCADPYPQPRTLAGERETRQGEEAGGAATAPWPKPAALSSAQCPIAAHLHRSRAPHGSDSRAPEAGPDERAAAPGQNEGHLHPKRRFRRSFLAF